MLSCKPLTDESLPAASAPLAWSWGDIATGDCLDLIREIPPQSPLWGSADVIYADPPFFTKRDFTGTHRPSRGGDPPAPDGPLSFVDRWHGGRHEYLAWLEDRIRAQKRLLAPQGVFLLHLDWHAVHYAKVLCDNIFGDDCFQNELIWYYQTGGASKDRFSRKHDTLLLYSHAPAFHFDGKAISIPRTPKAMKRARSGKGARIAATDTHKNPDDVLVVPALNPMARERTGFPTQKPLALLEMLITALCPPGGAVADLFCGSGTTLVAAQRLGRRFLGADVNPAAVALARRRIAAAH